MTVVTLLTDFGLRDGYPGVMKGVIWKIAPHVQIADLSHAITPHDILEASLQVWRAWSYFPDGTIHVAVVDPGVGTSRRPLAAKVGTHYFVGPDNGIITKILECAEDDKTSVNFVHLDQPQYWLPAVSHVFHGRDIFAPVAAYLANGVPLNKLGTEISDPVRLEIPKPIKTPVGWLGQVIHVDHFGNLSTNFLAHHIDQPNELIIQINGKQIVGIVATFGERPSGTLIALLDSSNSLAISVVNGNAAEYLHARTGDQVELIAHA